MAIKTLFTYNYGGDKIEDIKAFGYDVKVIPEEGLIYNDDLEEIEVLVCYDPFKTLDIEKMKKLK